MNFTGAMKTLRDPEFQKLLREYKRPPRTFLISYETQDVVTSERLIRGADGKEYKPEDYLTASERVERAFMRVTAGRTFTIDQRQWLERIRAHLIENLSISKDDFEIPVFERSGGWIKANRVFDGRLEDLLNSFNEAVAA